MNTLKANINRLQLIHLIFLMILSQINVSSVMAQGGPIPGYPPLAEDDWEMTIYNVPILIDVLGNDYGMSHPIDSSTLTIVSGPGSGTAEVDPLTGMVLYTPNTGFAGYDEFRYQVADTAGTYSNEALVTIWVANMPPTIQFMVYEDADDIWVFEGYVGDENPATCIVNFGGLLDGESTTVDPDGHFAFYKILDNGEEGIVTAQAKDELGEVSEVAFDEVYRYE